MVEHEPNRVTHQEMDLVKQYGQLYDYHKKMAGYHNQSYQAILGSKLKARSPKSDTVAGMTGKKIVQWPLDLSYAEIRGLKDSEIEKSINELILKKTYDLVEDQKKRFKNLIQVLGKYDVKLNKSGLLSIYFTNYALWRGAAHGLILADSLTVDLDTGKVYGLKDFLQAESNYIQPFNLLIKQQIKARKVKLITDFQTIHRDQQFYLTPQGIAVYFQIYAYTPYYYGISKFVIPYQKVMDLVLVEGPVTRLL